MRRDLVISSELENIEKVSLLLEQVFAEACLDKSLFNKVLLGLSEAVNNSIIHGNRLNPKKNVAISICLTGELVVVEIQDEGSGFCYEDVPNPTISENLRKERGRGIFLIRNMADEIAYFDGGRCVEIKYKIG